MAGDDPGDLIPRPDPSALTAAALAQAKDELRREIDAARKLLSQRDDGIEAELQVFVSALKDAPELHEQLRARLQTDIEIAVRRLEELHAEKFTSIVTKFEERNVWLHEKFDGLARQFAERDIRTDQATTAGKQALDAALLAAKELVGQQNTANVEAAAKAEASTTKQIDQIGVIIQTLEKSLTDRLTELKERIDRGEGSTSGSTQSRDAFRLNVGVLIAAAAMIVSLILGILLYVKK